MHMHQSIHGHHVVVQMSHDDHRSEYQETHDKNAKGERENIVGLVRRARDMQEEHQVNSHLSNCEYSQQNGDAGRINHIGRRSPKGGQRQNDRIPQPDQVTSARAVRVHVDTRRHALSFDFGTHKWAPKYTMVNTPIQTMSSACQNRPKQKKRRLTIGWNPSVATCNSMTTSQHRPRVTCSPCVPTKAKNAERKALRDGPAPMLSMWLNSLTSRLRNVTPKMKVIAIHK